MEDQHEDATMMGYGNCSGVDAMLGGGWMAGGWLSLLVVALIGALVVAAIVLAIRPRGRAAHDPDEILRQRFARGEISSEELAQARRALGG